MDVIDDRLVTQLSADELLRLRCADIAYGAGGSVHEAHKLYAFVIEGRAPADAGSATPAT